MSGSRPSSAGGTSRPPATGTPKEVPRQRSESRQSATSRTPSATKSAADDDTRTAVRVAVRVRPPLEASDPNYELVPQRFRGSVCKAVNATTLSVESSQGKKVFVFDKVFSEAEDQEKIWDYVSDSVRSFVHGYNVSILAYGQSGAGKSYTMGTTSPAEQADTDIMGIIPRAATALFDRLSGPAASRTPSSGLRTPTRYSTPTSPAVRPNEKTWQMRATYVEIYNEQLRDLLVAESVPQHERAAVTIREDTKGRIILTGLKQVSINTVEDLLSALNFGSVIRQTDSTAINSQSSRSHAVFSLNLIQKRTMTTQSVERKSSASLDAAAPTESWVTIDSKLHFVDLAGSERLKNSGLTGERVREGISINAGLASLGKVISQLSSRSAQHISYRDSRLTRILQDSLGGNAITYMLACVNPVEFHLSETLNTVQYAQRARAIQSKPQIQQRTDDADKQLVIDRLRSEVAFLRDQIRLSERSERRNGGTQSRNNVRKQEDRENELQNQLLDAQENYSALSQRHAKLISEIAQGKGGAAEEGALEEALQASSLERLNRSNNFVEAVEQVVMEYEKTIQSLEASLSSTRASLATSESSLLEKEAKIVYMEAVQQQLQSRVQKAMTREANSESYLKDLEAKLEGISSGEEKHLIIIQDLRKELGRIRESESSAEDYICTLEERLAEAEQDTEIMQREINRLEHVVERQRSIGKLDNLLQELDNIKHNEVTLENGNNPSTHHHTQSDAFHDRLVATASAMHPNGEVHPQAAEEEWKSFGPMEGDEASSERPATGASQTRAATDAAQTNEPATPEPTAPVEFTAAQSRALSDKLETVTCELFDLRVEHESTVSELDDVSRKYQIALTTLAELQDAVGGGRHSRSTPFLGEEEGENMDGQRSSSRTLSPELSSPGESPSLVETSEVGTTEYSSVDRVSRKEETLADSVRRLRRMNAEKDIDMAELSENYQQLQEQHKDTLNYIEELKDELQKSNVQQRSLPSPTHNMRSRKTYQFGVDRELRLFAALQGIADEHFAEKPDVKQQFDTNLTATMTEAQLRSERVEALESEVTAVRKEMEVKNTMITGLTKERSYRSSGPMDTSLLASMRDQLVESQKQIQSLQATKLDREKELLNEIQILKTSLTNHAAATALAYERGGNGEMLDTPATDLASSRGINSSEQQIAKLQLGLSGWESQHQHTVSSMNASEQQLLSTIRGLEAALRNAENLHTERNAAAELRADINAHSSNDNLESERVKHEAQVTTMQKEIDGYKATIEAHTEKLKHLEKSHAQILKEVESDAKSRELTESELQTHRDLVMNLEDQIDQQKSVATFHQQGLKTLQDNHAKELEELKKVMDAQQTEAVSTRAAHQQSTSALREELTRAHMEMAQLMEGVSRIIREEADPSNLHGHVMTIIEEHQDLTTKHEEAQRALEETRIELQEHKQNNRDLEDQLKEMASHNNLTTRQLERSTEKEQKSSRLVQELEEQLNQNYEEHRNTTNRLSTLQKSRTEMEKDLEDYRSKVSGLESQLSEYKRYTQASIRESLDPQQAAAATEMYRSASTASNGNHLRKSGSHASLPSPPPAVPLPPLPGNLNGNARDSTTASPPGSPHQSSDVQSAHVAQIMQSAQLIEEQEARIRTMEKHLYAEKQLTQTLEEALVDLETQANKTKSEMDLWKKRCKDVEEEASGLRKREGTMRHSLQAVEEERDKRIRAEMARKQLEERMQELAKQRKSKKGGLNCF